MSKTQNIYKSKEELKNKIYEAKQILESIRSNNWEKIDDTEFGALPSVTSNNSEKIKKITEINKIIKKAEHIENILDIGNEVINSETENSVRLICKQTTNFFVESKSEKIIESIKENKNPDNFSTDHESLKAKFEFEKKDGEINLNIKIFDKEDIDFKEPLVEYKMNDIEKIDDFKSGLNIVLTKIDSVSRNDDKKVIFDFKDIEKNLPDSFERKKTSKEIDDMKLKAEKKEDKIELMKDKIEQEYSDDKKNIY